MDSTKNVQTKAISRFGNIWIIAILMACLFAYDLVNP
jgi:hypothetical protein